MDNHQIQDKSKEVKFFDEFTLSKDYDVFTPNGYNAILNSFHKLAGDHLSKKQLAIDLGCGTGAFTKRFYDYVGCRMTGVDISPNSIKVAITKKQNIVYEVGDIEHLNYPDNYFDIIIYSGVLHHFHDFIPALKEGLRILKKGGILLSFDPHINNPVMWLYRHPNSPVCSKLGKTENEQLLSKEQMQSSLTQVGFENINIDIIGGVTFKYLESTFARCFLPVYNVFEYVLGKTFLARKYGSFINCFAQKPL